jgi:hypothetical protein
MKFPNLELESGEIEMHRGIEAKLLHRFNQLFSEKYSLNPDIKCSGSTEKGTALPERYFGVDFDASVKANPETLAKIAYISNVFEGCQLFSMDFFRNALQYLDSLYFAGHRISGKIEGRDFDFSITDEQKDMWKWQYNQSKYLRISKKQIDAVKKTKFFLKTFNVSGSEVYGIVGPATELFAYHHGDFRKIFDKMRSFSPMEENFGNAFNTTSFPREFYNMFPESEDPIHRGLVESFRYTSPNTFNRLVEAISASTLDKSTFLKNHSPKLNYKRILKTGHSRFVTYFLGTLFKEHEPFHIDLLTEQNGNIALYASANSSQVRDLDGVADLIEQSKDDREIDIGKMPRMLYEDIASKLMGEDPLKYRFFVGQPNLPIKDDTFYVPFDFLVRSDARKLVKVMEAGQNGAK